MARREVATKRDTGILPVTRAWPGRPWHDPSGDTPPKQVATVNVLLTVGFSHAITAIIVSGASPQKFENHLKFRQEPTDRKALSVATSPNARRRCNQE